MKRQTVILVAGFVIVSIAFLLLPRNPKSTVSEKPTGNDLKVDKAVTLVQNGENPMQGIQILLEVVREDSLNQKALYHLGVFSIQSTQYDKAIQRFNTLCRQPNLKYEDAWYLLSVAYANTNQAEKALDVLNKNKHLIKNEDLKTAMIELENSIKLK
jgi:lipopolysaccharide biosynthesis regulator YciM